MQSTLSRYPSDCFCYNEISNLIGTGLLRNIYEYFQPRQILRSSHHPYFSTATTQVVQSSNRYDILILSVLRFQRLYNDYREPLSRVQRMLNAGSLLHFTLS